jgi:transcriptional regulatory protein GAL4
MVLSIGAFCSDESNKNVDNYFYRNASRHLSFDLLQRGSLTLVQALTMMANYLQKRNRPNSGFTLLGVAMNMAQSIGLHREFSGATVSPFTMEIRRRVWWTLYIFDSGARLTFGRPTLALGGVNTQPPRNLDDKDLTVHMDELPESRDTPTNASSLIWQSKLAHIGNLASVKLLQNRVPPASVMLHLGDKVIEWFKSLPPYLQASSDDPGYENLEVPRMVLMWRSMHLCIVMYRPFILDLIKRREPLDLSNLDEAPRRCVDAAQECALSIVMFWNGTKGCHGALVWYACYWLVTTTFVHVTFLLYDPRHDWTENWRQQIESAKLALEEMGVFEPTAARAARVIGRIMGELTNLRVELSAYEFRCSSNYRVTDLVPACPDSTFFASNEPIRMDFAELWNQSWVDMALLQLQGSPFNYPNND